MFPFNILKQKPWETDRGPIDDKGGGAALSQPAEKVGLVIFLAVVTMLFTLFTIAYVMRMKFPDWNPLPDPTLLWLNTVILVTSSIALEWTRGEAARGELRGVRLGLTAAGISAILFLGGQLVAWQQLVASGYLASSNPANAFFYVITGLHGLHLLGGLVAWARTAGRVWRGATAEDVRLSVDLCATYWHYLLLVWLALFGLLLST